MQVIDNDHIIVCDVDDTLVMWIWDQYERTELEEAGLMVDVTQNNFSTRVKPNLEHIELLKRYKAKGKFIIVWSQSGYAWAETVVKALKLESYVDLILTKPEKDIDDLDANEWMEHVYLGTKNKTTPHN